MKRLLAIALFTCASASGLYAQVVDTTVCDVLSNPQAMDGKIVRIKGTVIAGLDQFIVKGGNCGASVSGIWISYPEGTKGKAGPTAVLIMQPARNFSGTFAANVRTPVILDKKNKDFKQFDSLLAAPHNKGAGMCLACGRYEVTATLVGRLDGVADASLSRNAAGKLVGLGGFGNMNAYSARLVLQSVSDISPKEVDFSKADAISKGNTTTFAGNADLFDPVVATKTSANAVGGGAGPQVQKAANAFGERGSDNGVIVGFGATNEVIAKEEAQGTKDSPDGVLYNCAFNMDRLQGDPMLRAMIHIGEHVVDMRSPVAGDEKMAPYDAEYKAWMIVVATAMGNRQNSLALPGGYVLWNATWTADERTKMIDDGLSKFLMTEEMMSK